MASISQRHKPGALLPGAFYYRVPITAQGLCPKCADLPIPEIFLATWDDSAQPSMELEALPLDSILNIASRVNACTLCHLVFHCLHSWLSTQHGHPPPDPTAPETMRWLEAFFEPDLLARMQVKLQFPIHSGAVVHKIHVQLGTDDMGLYETKDRTKSYTFTGFNAQVHFVLPLAPTAMDAELDPETALGSAGQKYPLRHVKDSVDVAWIRKVLEICDETHTVCAKDARVSAVKKPVGDFLVVDTEMWRICLAPPDCRYITLSYVWGQCGQVHQLSTNIRLKWEKPGGLPEAATLPKTIQDAVILVRCLGERYLWVDALCIIQDDPEAQLDQILQMDRIYPNSWFTIIAAHGTDCNAGLPGLHLGTRRRIQLVAESVQGMRAAVPLPTLADSLTSCSWNTRGWTMQELILTRRSVIFLEHQVYIQCGNRQIFREDACFSSSDPSSIENHQINDSWDHVIPAENSTASHNPADGGLPTISRPQYHHQEFSQEYSSVIEHFTARHLTNPSDVLNAIQGIMNRLKNLRQERGIISGMPIFGLHTALTWMPLSAAKPRTLTSTTKLPTWSWAAWECPVEIHPNARGCMVDDIYIHTPSGNRIHVPVFILRDQTLSPQHAEELKNQRSLKGDKQRCECYPPYEPILSQYRRLETEFHIVQKLQMRGHIAKLRIAGRESKVPRILGVKSNADYTCADLVISDENGLSEVTCGRVYILRKELVEVQRTGKRVEMEFWLFRAKVLRAEITPPGSSHLPAVRDRRSQTFLPSTHPTPQLLTTPPPSPPPTIPLPSPL